MATTNAHNWKPGDRVQIAVGVRSFDWYDPKVPCTGVVVGLSDAPHGQHWGTGVPSEPVPYVIVRLDRPKTWRPSHDRYDVTISELRALANALSPYEEPTP